MHKKLFRNGSVGIGSRRIVYERGCFDRFHDGIGGGTDEEPREKQEKNDLSYVDLGFALFIGIIIGMMAGSILSAL